MKLPESQRNSMYHCLNEQGNVIEHITEKYSHLLFFIFISSNVFISSSYRAFRSKTCTTPASKSRRTQDVLQPGKQAMLEFFSFQYFSLSAGRRSCPGGSRRAAGVIMKRQKQRHEISIMQAISLYVLQRQGFGSFCSTSNQRFLNEVQVDQAWK